MLIFLCLTLFSEPSAAEWLDKSIAYHYPNNGWANFAYSLTMLETRPGGTDRNSTLVMDVPGDRFVTEVLAGDTRIYRELVQGKAKGSLNGKTDVSDEDAHKHRLTPERISWLRNYYFYMWGLPAKLKDPGTILGEKAEKGEFLGKPVIVLNVRYQPEVGTDFWQFYLHPETAALVGCRFWRKDPKTDGEYIIFKEEYKLGDLRIPNVRGWYMNADDKHLGDDSITAHKPAN